TLEKKIDELRTFERDYRTRLKTYLDSQLQKLDERRPTPTAHPTRPQHNPATIGIGAHTHTR
ncbi:MAG TPA: hypothetical protein VE155_14345, partial [Pseudonocardiaceae bacterium]|nr:hypothetical protein [Pseudonocardiaceae bacterium]